MKDSCCLAGFPASYSSNFYLLTCSNGAVKGRAMPAALPLTELWERVMGKEQ